MKPGENIFVFGSDPGVNAIFRSEQTHPMNKKIHVRFVKNMRNSLLYFNVHDFISGFENKRYKEVIQSILPRKMKNLKKVWMATKAWDEIKDSIERNEEQKEIQKWKEQELF